MIKTEKIGTSILLGIAAISLGIVIPLALSQSPIIHYLYDIDKATIGETFWYNGTRYCYVVLTGSDYLIDRYYSNCNFFKGDVLPDGIGLGNFCASDPRKTNEACDLHDG